MRYLILTTMFLSTIAFAGPPKIDPSTLAEDSQFESLEQSLPGAAISCICSVNQSPTVQAVEVVMPSDTRDKVETCRNFESKFYPVKASRDRGPVAYAALLKCEPRVTSSGFATLDQPPAPISVQAAPDPSIAQQFDKLENWGDRMNTAITDLKSSLERLESRLDRVMIKTGQLQTTIDYQADVQVSTPPPAPTYIPVQPTYTSSDEKKNQRDGGPKHGNY